MPGKGKAFDKPTVNAHHKQAVRAQAQLFATVAAGNNDPLLKELSDMVMASNVSDMRQRAALESIRQAVRKLRDGKDPESGLRPPPDCAACDGKHKPHHFLCLKRSLPPPEAELKLKKQVQKRLRAAFREVLYDEQTVSACFQPCALLLRLVLPVMELK